MSVSETPSAFAFSRAGTYISSAILNDRCGVFGWLGTNPSWHQAFRGVSTPEYYPRMPEVEVDAELASRAAEKAAARGESLEEVIARALERYLASSPGEFPGE